MAFFMDPGAMFLGCLGPSEQKFLVTLIETAAKSGYTRFVEPCAGTFAMANLAVQNGFKPEQIETSDVNMMSTVLGYAITGQSLEPLEIHAQGFSDEELLDPATALYAQLYLRTSKNAGNDYFYQILTDLRLRREEHIESINRQIEVIKNLLGGMSYRPLDMWEHLKEVLDDPHALVIANPPTYFSGYEKFYDTQGKMTWKEPPYELFDPETGHQQFYDLCMDAKALVICYQEKRVGEAVGYTIYARSGTRADLNAYITTNREEEATALANGKKIKRPAESKLQPLDCSMLPRDYVIREDSKVQVIPIKSAEAQYYRELWTHNFVGSSATFNRAYMRAHIKRYAQECKKRNECQQPIDHEIIREKLGMSKLNYESMRKVIARHETASLDTYLNESDPESGTLQDIIASNENVSQSVIESVTDRELHELMQKVLSILPDNERNVIMLRFYQGHSMSHIANEFQCTRQNISDILKRAYIRIRHSKYSNELIDFLPEYSMRNVYEKYETKYTSDKEKYEKASERLAKELSENERNLLL